MDGVSPQGLRIIDRLEVARRWPGMTADAVRSYRRFARGPSGRSWDDSFGCGELGCCPDPAEIREWLEMVLHHLPHRDRRTFQALLLENDVW